MPVGKHGIEIKFTPPDLIRRMQNYPRELNRLMKETNKASLLALHEKVPPYPSPPENSTYTRTGTLGRTLGVSEDGGKIGNPSIFEQRKLGTSGYEGTFGTNLEYAGYVIGEQQAWMHVGRWWTLRTVMNRAYGKILKLHKIAAEGMVAFLEGKG